MHEQHGDDSADVDPWDISENIRADAPPPTADASSESHTASGIPGEPPPPEPPAQVSDATDDPPVESHFVEAQPPAPSPVSDPAYPSPKPLPAHLTHVQPQPPRVPPPPPPPPQWRPIPVATYAAPRQALMTWVILKPRIWPSLTTVAVAFALAITASVIALLVAFLLDGTAGLGRGRNFGHVWARWMSSMMSKGWGPAVLILPTQLAILGAAVVAAALSPVSFRQRLGLVRSRYPWWTYVLFMVGTPVVAMAAAILGLVAQHFQQRGGTTIPMDDLTRLVHGPPGLSGLLMMLVLLAVLPALSEEMLFRGLLQRRLLSRWPVAGAIALATGMFLIAHLNPLQMIVLIPLGTWLGVLAWQSGSILPSICCHLANNAVAITMARLFSDISVGSPSQTMTVVGLAIIPLMIMVLAMIASIAWVAIYARRHGPPINEPLPDRVMRRVTTRQPPPPGAIIHSAPPPPPHVMMPPHPQPAADPLWPLQSPPDQNASR